MADEIDSEVFRELQATAGAEFVAELVDTFLEEAPGMLAALREARAADDADAFRRAAHSLKSNSLTFGATALADAARGLELGGIGSDEAIDALQREFDAAAQALKALRDA
jgi:histidine phosphotransfer protein HptB